MQVIGTIEGGRTHIKNFFYFKTSMCGHNGHVLQQYYVKVFFSSIFCSQEIQEIFYELATRKSLNALRMFHLIQKITFYFYLRLTQLFEGFCWINCGFLSIFNLEFLEFNLRFISTTMFQKVCYCSQLALLLKSCSRCCFAIADINQWLCNRCRYV